MTFAEEFPSIETVQAYDDWENAFLEISSEKANNDWFFPDEDCFVNLKTLKENCIDKRRVRKAVERFCEWMVKQPRDTSLMIVRNELLKELKL